MMNDKGIAVVTVRRDELLTTLKKNLEEHAREYMGAMEGFKVAYLKELETMAADARTRGEFRRVVSEEEPPDHSKDYKRVIRMLEMATTPEISITEHEFARYVMDEWEWKDSFSTMSAKYRHG
jgi:hypothetical protein